MVSSIKTGYFFFIPIGEQPPLKYPVRLNRAFKETISIDLSPVADNAFFTSNSSVTGRQKTLIPVFDPFVTNVLKTLSAYAFIRFATVMPSMCLSSMEKVRIS